MSKRGKPEWTHAALRDLDVIVRFYRSNRAKSATKKLTLELKQAAVAIAAMPEAGAVALDLEPVGKYRHVVVGPYRIIYRIDGPAVIILRVWDARKDPASIQVEGKP